MKKEGKGERKKKGGGSPLGSLDEQKRKGKGEEEGLLLEIAFLGK